MSDAADAFPFRPLPPPLRYAIALAAVSLVYLVSRSFDSLIDEGSQFLLLGTAVMKLLGRAAWWAPGPLARFYNRFGIKETDLPTEADKPVPVAAG